jgi:tetratricopeptide (TPR) repeat protein
VIREDVAVAAARLYRESALETADPEIEVALRDGRARRDLERLVAGILADDPGAVRDVAGSILAGGERGSAGGPLHRAALAAFRTGRRPLPVGLGRFLDLAARPARYGDAYAAATLDDDRTALFRILVQVELAPAGTAPGASGLPAVRVDEGFGRGAASDPVLGRRAGEAVEAAVAYLQTAAPGRSVRDLDRAVSVRVFRGGLPWPLARDTAVPTAFQLEQDERVHDGPSMGLPIALAVLHAFLPEWTCRPGPLAAATGELRPDGSVEAVGDVERKAGAAAAAELPFLYPRRGTARFDEPGFGQVAVEDLDEAATEAFELAGDDVSRFLALSPRSMYGREAERRQVLAAWDRARGGEARLVVLAGPAGAGKSALAAHVVRELAGSGIPVLFASSTASGAVLARVVQRLVRGHSLDDLRRLSSSYGSWLGTFEPDLFRFLPDHYERVAAAPGYGDVIEQRSRTATAVLRKVAGRRQGLVVVLDDVQWASDDTWPILETTFDPAGARVPLLVVATYRDDPPAPAAEAALARLRARGAADEVRLEGLGRAAIRTWIADASTPAVRDRGDEVERVAEALEGATDGNPLQLYIRMAELASPGLSVGDFVRRLDGVRRENEEQKARRLRDWLQGHLAFPVLGLASVIRSGEFTVPLLLECARSGGSGVGKEAEVVDRLRAAERDRLVKLIGGRYAFEHDSLRDAVVAAVAVEDRARFHRQVGEALERRALARGARLPVRDLAHHFCEAVPFSTEDVGEKAVHYAGLAAEAALGELDYPAAREHRLRALEAFDFAGLHIPEQRTRLLLEAARACSYVGREEEARPYFREARDLAVDEGLVDEAVEATLGFAGPPEDKGFIEQQLLDYLEEAVSLPLPAGDRRLARLQGRLTFERVMAARREPEWFPMPPVTELLATARASGDDVDVAWALLVRLLGSWTLAEPPAERLALADEMRTIGGRCGEKDIAAWAQGIRVVHLLELARREEAEEANRQMAIMGKELHHGYARWGAAGLGTVFSFLDGDFAGVHLQAAEAEEVRDSATSVIYHRIQRMVALREEGRLAEIEPLLVWLRSPDGVGGGYADWALALDGAWAAWCSDCGRYGEARAVLDRTAVADVATCEDLTALALLAETAAALADPRLAGPLYERMRLREGHAVVIAVGVACLGAVDRYLGLLAGLAGEWDAAERHFESAARINEHGLRSPVWLAHTRFDHAAMLARCRRPADRKRARWLCSSALSIAGELGMRRLGERAAALLARLT